MSNHFVDLLESLRSRVARMTSMVQQSVEMACQSVIEVNERLALQCIDGDRRVDEEEVQVEKDAIGLLALHQPAASDLRLITTIIKVNSDLERIADCAVNVAQRVPYLRQVAGYRPPQQLVTMANSVTETLRETIKAFNLNDEGMAMLVVRGDDVVDALYQQIVQDMLAGMQADPHQISPDLSNIMIAKNLERVADHCTNIAENVIYVHTGRIIRHQQAVR